MSSDKAKPTIVCCHGGEPVGEDHQVASDERCSTPPGVASRARPDRSNPERDILWRAQPPQQRTTPHHLKKCHHPEHEQNAVEELARVTAEERVHIAEEEQAHIAVEERDILPFDVEEQEHIAGKELGQNAVVKSTIEKSRSRKPLAGKPSWRKLG